MNKLKRLIDVGYWGLLVVLLVFAGLTALSVWQPLKVFKFYVVLSGSMEPTIHTGSVVFVNPQASYKEKDIVTFQTKPEVAENNSLIVTHRIVKIEDKNNAKVFTTKGDANNTPDLKTITEAQILGKVALSIPFLGYPIDFVKTQNGFILLIVIPATIIIYSELMTIKNEAKRLIQERKIRKLNNWETVEEKIGEEIIEVEKDIKKIVRPKTSKPKKHGKSK